MRRSSLSPAALSLLAAALTASAAGAQSMSGDLIAAGAGRSLCDLCATTSTIVLGDAGTILGTGDNVTVRINGLGHSWMGDLVASLTFAPVGGGAPITSALFTRVGGSGDPNGSFSFNDGFATPIGSVNLGGGDFRPEGSLAAFNGLNVQGSWTLHVDDRAGADVGRYASWELGLVTAPTTVTPEPGTWALLATGLVGVAGAAARRRRVAQG